MRSLIEKSQFRIVQQRLKKEYSILNGDGCTRFIQHVSKIDWFVSAIGVV